MKNKKTVEQLIEEITSNLNELESRFEEDKMKKKEKELYEDACYYWKERI